MPTPPAEPPSSGGIHVGDVRGNVSFSALGDIVGGDKITTVTTTIQISVEAVTQRPLITVSPYRGLERFEDRDRDVFFGRDQLIKSLLAQLSNTNVLLVLGASGSGKSSVVRAGVLPRLSQLMGRRFRYFTLVPDVNPFESLRSALTQVGGFSQAQTCELLDAQPDTAIRLIRGLQREGDQWLIFVDQFEEIFTVSDERLRTSFISALVRIAQDPTGSIKLVLAMRADFSDRLSPFPQFAKLVEKNIAFVSDMQIDELRLAIEQPAAQHGVVFEQGLVEEIIKDVQGQAGSLPLLQYTLSLLWQEEERGDGLADRHLKTQTYRELGGVRGALQKRADDIYDPLGDEADAKRPSAKQEIVRQIFLRLVDIAGTGSDDAVWRLVRRRVPKENFRSQREQEILQTLIDQKLLVSSGGHDTDATVEVAHEALFTSWARLKNWIEGGKQVIFTRNRLADGAAVWNDLQKTDPSGAQDELLSGSRLGQALEMRARGDFLTILGGLTETETQFLDASRDNRDTRLKKERVRQQRELAQLQALAAEQQLRAEEQKRLAEAAKKLAKQSTARLQAEEKARRRLRNRAIALLALVIATVGLATVAWTSQRNAKRTFSRSDFIRAADFLDQGETANAMAYLARAVDTWPENHAAADRMFNLLTQRQFCLPITEPLKVQGTIGAVHFNSKAACLVAVVDGSKVQIWNVIEQRVCFPPLIHKYPVHSVQFSEDGKLLGTGCGVSAEDGGSTNVMKAGGYAQLWSAETGKPVAGALAHDGAVLCVSFSKSGDRIVTASEDETARIWDTGSGKQVGKTIQHKAPVLTAEFSTDGHRIVTASGELAVWNVEGGALVSSAWEEADASFSVHEFYDADAQDDEDKCSEALQLVGKLQGTAEPLSQFLWSQFSAAARELLGNLNAKDGTKQLEAVSALVEQLNKILKGSPIYTDTRFQNVELSPETLALKSANPEGEALVQLNRLLLEDAYGLRKKNQATAISAKFSPDGKRVVGVLNAGGFVRVFDAEQGKPLGDPKSKYFDFAPGTWGGVVTSIDSSPDGNSLIATYAGIYRNKDDTGYSLRLSWKDGEAIGEPRDHHHAVDSVRFSPDGGQFVTTCEDGIVRFWDSISDELAPSYVSLKLEAPPRLAQFSPDGKHLLIVEDDPATLGTDVRNHLLQIYSAGGAPAAGQDIKYPGQGPPTDSGTVLAVSPDKGRIVKKLERSAALYDAKTGQLLGSPLPMEVEFGDQGDVFFARFSPDGKRFVTGVVAHFAVLKGFARLWDGNDGHALSEPLRHTGSVIDAVFRSDGQRFLTIAADVYQNGAGTSARLWDAETGRPLDDSFPENRSIEAISVTTAEFIDEGRRVRFAAEQGKEAPIFDVGLPTHSRVPGWFSLLARLVGGYELNQKSGIIEPVPNRLRGLNELRKQLAGMDDPYGALGKWVLSDPATRTVSPYSKGSTSPTP